MTKILLVPSKSLLSSSVYYFAKSTQKLLFMKTRGFSVRRLNRLVSVNRVLSSWGVCSTQQLQNFSKLLLSLNSSLLKFWFTELSLIGLGFRFVIKDLGASFRLNVGCSHANLVAVLPDLFLIKRKKRCLVVSSNLTSLRTFVTRILSFRKSSVYKLKGLQLKGLVFKLKPGKRSK